MHGRSHHTHPSTSQQQTNQQPISKKSIKWTRIIWKMTTNTSDLYFNWYNSYSSTDTHNTPRFFLKKTRGKGTPEDLPSFIGGTNLKRGKEREEERERKGEQVKEMSHNLIRDNWEQSREGGTSKSVLRGTEKEPHQNFTNFRVEKFKSEFFFSPTPKIMTTVNLTSTFLQWSKKAYGVSQSFLGKIFIVFQLLWAWFTYPKWPLNPPLKVTVRVEAVHKPDPGLSHNGQLQSHKTPSDSRTMWIVRGQSRVSWPRRIMDISSNRNTTLM